MALFTNQLTSNLADLISKLNTFLTTGGAGNPGWTADAHVPASGVWAISHSDGTEDIEVAFQWDTTSPNALGIYQYYSGTGPGSYAGGSSPWAQTGDSGNGAASTSDATLLTGRHAPITNTPTQFWCFAGDPAAGDVYAHVVVEVNGGLDYVHFGFGIAEKTNDFTGGAYAYGYRWDNVSATSAESTFLLDGLARGSAPGPDMEDYVATIRLTGMTDSPASGLWAVWMGSQGATALGQDRQGSPIDRIHVVGGFRGSTFANFFGVLAGSIVQGHIPAYSIVGAHFDRDVSGTSTQSGSLAAPMFVMKDVLGMNIRNFEAKQQVLIGSDTWHVFPIKRKGSSSNHPTSGHSGIIYKEN
jgi:hypothetical protein